MLSPILNEWIQAASFLLMSAGVLVAILGFGRVFPLRAVLPLVLDFWVAGGLLKLTGAPNWKTILTAAAFIVIRKAAMLSMRHSHSQLSK